jgi:hypothetical protein
MAVSKIKANSGNYHVIHDMHYNRVVIYGHSWEELKKYLAGKLGHKFCNTGGDHKVFAVAGTYQKTRGIGKTEIYDSLNLRHNGWVGGIAKSIPSPANIPGMGVIRGVGPSLLTKVQYFVAICSNNKGANPPKNAKFLHNQKSTYLIVDGSDSLTYGHVLAGLNEMLRNERTFLAKIADHIVM